MHVHGYSEFRATPSDFTAFVYKPGDQPPYLECILVVFTNHLKHSCIEDDGVGRVINHFQPLVCSGEVIFVDQLDRFLPQTNNFLIIHILAQILKTLSSKKRAVGESLGCRVKVKNYSRKYQTTFFSSVPVCERETTVGNGKAGVVFPLCWNAYKKKYTCRVVRHSVVLPRPAKIRLDAFRAVSDVLYPSLCFWSDMWAFVSLLPFPVCFRVLILALFCSPKIQVASLGASGRETKRRCVSESPQYARAWSMSSGSVSMRSCPVDSGRPTQRKALYTDNGGQVALKGATHFWEQAAAAGPWACTYTVRCWSFPSSLKINVDPLLHVCLAGGLLPHWLSCRQHQTPD